MEQRPDLPDVLQRIETFIERELAPLEAEHPEFFDHRREFARTDLERGGAPSREWQKLLVEMMRRADAAGLYRFALPAELGGSDGTNLEMAVIREHLANKPIGLHSDLQSESACVGNFPIVLVLHALGSPEQRELIEPLLRHELACGFGLTEPGHGSDATWLESTAVRDGLDWVINGAKRFNTGMHVAQYDIVFARTSGEPGDAAGITAFLVATDTPGFEVRYHHWTFNMPTDHSEVELRDVRVPSTAIIGEEGSGLAAAMLFVHENRIRQAASSLGAAQFCVDRSVAYARERVAFGKPLAVNQAIQFPLAELHTDCALVRELVRATAAAMDDLGGSAVSDRISMCNLRANRLACEAADRAIQVHGGIGYTRALPFEHVYRHHRRYRITEGSEEMQLRNIARRLFGFGERRQPRRP
ncbi:MAG TPA: acyl-CoA dehydrogenase family protein [Solirubrobacteraceae bacterium]|nr:acyl-CoA dehydrogenase family protein [Solirubrobacteraceae bacterium]